MTGQEILQVRTELGMTPTNLAAVIGVHPSTLYRWEAATTSPIKVEPMQLQLLTLMQQELLKRKSQKAKDDLGKAIITALLVRGGLFALYALLDAAFSKGK